MSKLLVRFQVLETKCFFLLCFVKSLTYQPLLIRQMCWTEVREDAGLPFIVNMSNEVTARGEIRSRIYVVKFNSFRGIF